MKILVISDTHNDIRAAADVIRNEKNTDLVIHLGDYFRDAQKLNEMFPGIAFEYVYGNCDFGIGSVPSEKLLVYQEKNIFITHGHRYSVRWGCEKLKKKAYEERYDIVLFGHTHEPYSEETKNCILLNPGSISFPRNDSGFSYAILEINEGVIKPCLVCIET